MCDPDLERLRDAVAEDRIPTGLFERESSRRTGVIAVYVVSTESSVIVSLSTADHVPRPSCHWT